MLIKNLTSKQQKISVTELTGDHREIDIFLKPDSTTDLDRMLVFHAEKYAGIIEVVGCPCCKKEEPVIVEEKKEEIPEVVAEPTPVEETPEVKEEVPVEETPEEKDETPAEETPEAFICDICGAEFASARGLASHKNKAHAE